MKYSDRSSLTVPMGADERRCSFYFTRLSVDEEDVYCSVPQTLVSSMRDDISGIAEASVLVEAYERILNVNLLSLFNVPRLNGVDSRLHKLYQTGVHALLGIYLKHRLNLQVDAVGFYSGGATSAFLFAGIYSATDYIHHIYPFNLVLRETMNVEGKKRNLTQVLLVGNPGDDIENSVDKYLSDHVDLSQAFIKDRRQSHAILVAGPLAQINCLVKQIEDWFPAVAQKRSPILKHRFASHSPYLDLNELSSHLEEKFFHPPWTTVVGTRGESLPPRYNSLAGLKRLFAEGVIGPMNTGRAIDVIARHNERILVVGGFHGAKVLAGLNLRDGVSIDLAPEFAVKADSTVVGKPVYDGRITEYAAG